MPGVRNYNVAVSEADGNVVFLHKIVPGGADRSYGIHVAQLAGLPTRVIERAREILTTLEENSGTQSNVDSKSPVAHKMPAEPEYREPVQISLFGSKGDDVIDELNALDISNMTPLQALNKLQDLKKKAES